ncbi:hypothetical protein [Ensifer sp. 4252]|uniref:hypothetical protein n=1 Tax=Ensifer sp. 4252 TaxID=3373915 RepID=UPI003D1C96A3
MGKALQSVMRGIWIVSVVSTATAIGIAYGWQTHGWVGAALFGLIGYGSGALFAYSPSLLFDLAEFWAS